jgi:hypothetical protein
MVIWFRQVGPERGTELGHASVVFIASAEANPQHFKPRVKDVFEFSVRELGP